jgi:hypothetical protein
MRPTLAALAILGLAGGASAQTTQSDMLAQTAAASANPMSAWQASFSPNMVSRLRPISVHDLSPNCRSVVVALDKKPATSAGVVLVTGRQCVTTARDGLKAGLATGGVANGLTSAPVTAAISGDLGD